MSKYRIYVDETGNSDLGSSDNNNHRFLTLTGVILDLEYVRNILYPELETIKNEIFNQHPDNPIIFHRKEMVNKKYPFEILRNNEVESKFNNLILDKLKQWDYEIITILIDKKEHNEKYKVWKHDPYHYCLEILLERYLFFLERRSSTGDVMIESRGGKEDRRLKRSFTRLFEEGTNFLPSDFVQKYLTSKQLKVKNKTANISGLQLADLIAHPSRRDFLVKLGFEKKGKYIFGDRIIEIIEPKYVAHRGEILGCGMKKLP